MSPALYRVKDAADYMALSQREVRRLADAGILHRSYIGASSRKYYRITAASIEEYLASLPAEAVKA